MSLDLYERETLDKLGTMPPVQVPDASTWDGFTRGTALYTMQGLAKTGRAIDLLGSIGPIAQDAITGGTTAQDRYFKEHDDVWGSAVKYWTPDTQTVGKAAQVAGGLIGLLPQVIASPGLAVGANQLGTGEDLVDEGVPAGKAQSVGAIQAAGLGLGVWLPILGANLWQRVVLGGIGLNTALGIATRGASGALLKGEPAAEDFKAFDPSAITLDVLLGAAFGSLAHLSPEARAHGQETLTRLQDWAKRFKPSDVDALATLRQAQHMNVDSTPGKPVAPSDIEAHVEKVKTAIEQLERNQPVETSDLPAGHFTPDPERQVEAGRTLDELVQTTDETLRAEGIIEPQVPNYLHVTDELRATYEDLQRLPREEQAQGVRDVVEAQLQRAGVPDHEAAANAAVWEAFAKTAHERYGIAPADVLTKYGVTIQRGDRSLPGALEQRAAGQPAGREGTVGHGQEAQSGERSLDFTGSPGGAGQELHATVGGGRPAEGWARATRIRGGDGQPAPLYRGAATPLAAEHFRTEQLGQASGNPSSGLGVWFSTDHTEAAGYGNVERFNLDMRNPKVIRVEDLPGFDTVAEANAYREQLRAEGHDGIIVTAKHLGGRVHAVAFDPHQVIKEDTATRTLYQQPVKSAEPFYSELARQVDATEMKSGSARSWKEWIKGLGGKGVKAEEVKWSGLEEWLDLQQGKITKEAVQEFLRNNGVRVSETMLGQPGERGPQDAEIAGSVENLDGAGFRLTEAPEEMQGDVPRWGMEDVQTGDILADAEDARSYAGDIPDEQIEAIARVLDYLNGEQQKGEGPPTKFSTYQLPGGQNYRELLLTLPTPKGKTDTAKMDRVAQLRQEWEALRQERDGLPAEGALEQWRELGRQLRNNETQQALAEKEAAADHPAFQSSHFEEPNILSHVRFNDRVDADGKRVLFIEEIQSDWAQQGRKKGFADAEEDAALVTAHNQAMDRTALAIDQAMAALRQHAVKGENIGAQEGVQQAITSRLLSNLHTDWDVRGGTVEELLARKSIHDDPVATAAMTEYFHAVDAEGRLERQLSTRNEKGRIPSAPFVGKTEAWVALTLKRMIRYAAENGYERIAWTHGAQQVERYSQALRKAVDAIEWEKTDKGVRIIGYKGKKAAPAVPEFTVVANHQGEPVWATADRRYSVSHNPGFQWRWDGPGGTSDGGFVTAEAAIESAKRHAETLHPPETRKKVVDTTEKEDVLSDAIGKSMADRIRNDPNQRGTIEGEAINVSDTGMAGFYDRIVPKVAKDVLKKLGGGQIGETKIDTSIQGNGGPPPMATMSARDRDNAFQGAEDFPNGDAPLTGETTIMYGGRPLDVTLVAHANGLEFLDENGSTFGVPWSALSGDLSVRNASVANELIRDYWPARSALWRALQRDDPEGGTFGPGPRTSAAMQPAIDITPAMKEKALAGQPLFQASRGQIQFGDEQTIINLFENANASTFVHETGHFFLQLTRDLANSPNAPLEAMHDWRTLQRELGFEGHEIPREAHEQFARSFEAYLREGEAPSPELKTVFQQFRDWLVGIYHSLSELNVKVTDELRGVMDRMLTSQRKDPSPGTPSSAPPVSASGAGNPPPPGGGSETPAATGPKEPHVPLTLEAPEMRSAIEHMAANEAGWFQVGGKHLGGAHGTPNFSTWIPNADWWIDRPGKLNEAKTKEAVRKALAGEPLKKAEQRMVDYLVDVANKRMAQSDLPAQEYSAVAADLIGAGEPVTHQNVIDQDLVARAAAIDESAVESAAVKHENDDGQFMAEMRRIVDEHEASKAGGGSQKDQRPTQDQATGSEDPEARVLALEAERVVAQAPDQLLTIGNNPDGSPIQVTAREYLEQARNTAALAREDAKLFEVAAGCLMGKT